LARASAVDYHRAVDSLSRFRAPAALLRSQVDTLEEPDPSEDPLTVEVGPPAAQVADEIIRLLGASATVVQGVLAHPN
jgi:gluconate kinase